MSVFQIIDQGTSASDGGVAITDLHFGGNLLVNYSDVLDRESDLYQSIRDLGLETIRYPGGAVTEQYFNVNAPNASSVEYKGSRIDLIPLSDFLDYAASTNVSVTMVIPTRDGFTKSAEKALLDGTYGDRVVDKDFVADAAAFAVKTVQEALVRGVVIDALEIGNEFWGSGKMGAAEYGRLAAGLSVAIEAALSTAGIAPVAQPNIIVQATAATAKYSPTPNSIDGLFIYEMDDGSLWSSPQQYGVGVIPPDFNGIAVSRAFGKYTVPSQGFINFQNAQIIDALMAKTGAVDAIDGIVLHYYGDVDIADVDILDRRLFDIFALYEGLNEQRAHYFPPLLQFVTEWNIRGGETHPSNGSGGLIQAQYLVEMFYQMVSNGIDAAHVWPIRNEGVQLSSMLDVDGEGLSIAGELFASMSELLVGLTPSLDVELALADGSRNVDIHGFENEDREVFYVAERLGVDGIVTLDLADVVKGDSFFVTVKILGAQGNPVNPNAEPVWSQNGISIINRSPTIDVMLSPYSIAVVDVTQITETADLVRGSSGNDRISGLGGHDRLYGAEGDDTLFGGMGADNLHGGVGDDVIYGDAGDDIVIGGEGSDALFGRAGNDLLMADQDDILVNGGTGIDTLSLTGLDSAATIWGHEELIELDNWTIAFEDIEIIEGSAFADRISVTSSVIDFRGMDGNDHFEVWSPGSYSVSGDTGDDTFYIFGETTGVFAGGAGNDTFFIWFGRATYEGGQGDDRLFSFNSASDTFVFEANTGNDTIFGYDVGVDQIQLNAGSPAAFSWVAVEGGSMIEFDQGGSVFLSGVDDPSLVDDMIFNQI